jgi:hypothetical protein
MAEVARSQRLREDPREQPNTALTRSDWPAADRIQPSMGALGRSYDINTIAESFFAALKAELRHRRI